MLVSIVSSLDFLPREVFTLESLSDTMQFNQKHDGGSHISHSKSNVFTK